MTETEQTGKSAARGRSVADIEAEIERVKREATALKERQKELRKAARAARSKARRDLDRDVKILLGAGTMLQMGADHDFAISCVQFMGRFLSREYDRERFRNWLAANYPDLEFPDRPVSDPEQAAGEPQQPGEAASNQLEKLAGRLRKVATATE